MNKTLYTIGYSGFPEVKDFIARLQEFGIQAVIDVRSSPYSGYYEQYNKESLKAALHEAGIIYKNYAAEFGARQEELKYYRKGRLDFALFTQSEAFQSGFRKIYDNLGSYTFTLMCAEKDPITCHRTIMVARKFDEAGVDVEHIWPDHVESHGEIRERLLDLYCADRFQGSLFADAKSDEELLDEAYEMQNDKIGFKEEGLKA